MAPWFTGLDAEAQGKAAKLLTGLVEAEGAGFDLAPYRDAPPGVRIWGGATVETADIEALLPWLDLEGNVDFGLDFKRQPQLSRAERQARVDRAIAEVGLTHARHLRPAALSGGMAQRAALARALTRRTEARVKLH